MLQKIKRTLKRLLCTHTWRYKDDGVLRVYMECAKCGTRKDVSATYWRSLVRQLEEEGE